MNNQSMSSWNFEYPFHFESNGSLEQVVHSLAQLEENGSFFSSTHNDISIVPEREGYSFRYRIRRRNKNSLYTTAVGEGQVWEEDGSVIVEGQSQIDTWSLYGGMGIIMLMIFLFTIFARGSFGIFPLLLLGAGAFMIIRYYRDRNLVVDHIGEAVAVTHSIYSEKLKRDSGADKAKNTRLNVNETVNPNSVWNDAISEYDNLNEE